MRVVFAERRFRGINFGFVSSILGVLCESELALSRTHAQRSTNVVSFPDSHPYVSSLVCAAFMFLTPLWIVVSSKHPASRTLLYSGWEPVITAMVISRCVPHSECVFVCACVYFSVEKAALGCPQPPLSAVLDDPPHPTPELTAAPQHLHRLHVPLGPAALPVHPPRRIGRLSLPSRSYASAITLGESTLAPSVEV